MSESPTVGFVCVRNAGRSQMASAFAERERAVRGLDVEAVTGGTRPAESVHDNVARAMRDRGIEIGDRSPREITFEELQDCEYVITMGCDAADVCPAGWSGENRDWGLEDPHGKSTEETARIRDEVERRVSALFDELERDHG